MIFFFIDLIIRRDTEKSISVHRLALDDIDGF